MSERASPPPVLVVTGMHRSGTSFAASLVQAAGLHVGDRLLAAHPSNPLGHFEDLDFYEFDRHLLRSHGVPDDGFTTTAAIRPGLLFQDAARQLVDARRRRGIPWGWKDPRVTLLLDFWADLIPEARFLLVFRPPWDVIDSLYRRGDPLFVANPPFALDIWRHFNARLVDFARRHPDRVLVREVSQLATDPTGALVDIRDRLGIPLDTTVTTFRPELLVPASPDAAAFMRAAAPEAAALLADLRALPGASGDVPASDRPPLAAVLDHGLRTWQQTRRLERELGSRASDLAAECAHAAATDARLVAADSRIAAYEERLAAVEAARAELADTLVDARAAAAAHEAAAQETRRQLGETRRRASDATADATAARAHAARTAAALDEARGLTHALRDDRERTRAQLDAGRDETRRLAEMLRERENECRALAVQHASLTAADDASRRERTAAASELATSTARIAALEATVQELVGSTSWRITAPARAAVEALRRSGLRGRATRACGTLAKAARFVLRRLASPATARRSAARAVEIVRARGLSGLVRAVSSAHAVETARTPPRDVARRGLARMPCGADLTPRSPMPDDANEPLVSVLVPVFDTPAAVLEATIQSLLAQTWPRLELVVVDDASAAAHVPEILARHAARDTRLRVHRRGVNGGISAATNDALARATGSYVALVDHDDTLEPDAIERAVEALRTTGADAVYTDQDTIDVHGRPVWTFHKPDWSPEYLRHVMYVGHLLVVRRALAVELGGFRSAFDGVQDYEFMLRLAERTRRIAHVPEVLYHWRAASGSVAAASDAKPGIDRLQVRAVQEHLDRLGVAATASAHPRFPHRCVVTPRLTRFPRVSIVIPTKDRPDLIGPCLESILDRTRYPDFEVVVVDSGTTDPRALAILREHPLTVVPFTRPFNFSAAVNAGAAAARGEILVFLNNDTTVISPEWLEHLAFHLAAADVGAVGPLLIYPDGSVQHAGVVLGARGTADHVMRRFPADADGYAGSLSCPREVSAVTGACLAIRRDVLDRVGGWNELYATHYQDVDLCLRLGRAGLRCLFTPDVRLVHHESPSRGDRYDFLDRLLLVDTWRDVLAAGDPAYPADCSLERLDYSPRDTVQEAARASHA